jgi:hypothetical protein
MDRAGRIYVGVEKGVIISAGMPEAKRQLGRLILKQDDNIKADLQEIWHEGLTAFNRAIMKAEFHKVGGFLDQLNLCQLPKNNCTVPQYHFQSFQFLICLIFLNMNMNFIIDFD